MACFLLLFRMLLCLQYLLLFHFPLFSFSSSLNSSRPSFLCLPDQSSALLLFNNSFEVDVSFSWMCDNPFPKTRTWENGTDCCSWEGVTCDSMSGHVIGLDLSCSGLGGKIHPNSTLFRLTHLQRLNLAFNDFNNSQLASQVGGFLSLTHLNLSGCSLEGDIPSQISHLSKLASLDLSRNALNRKGPAPFSFANLTHLTYLDLSYNELKGSIPSSLSNLSHLTHMDLSFSELSGPIPSFFSNLLYLTHLNLSYNELSGPIPSFVSNLLHLTHLDLSDNELNGSIPSSLSNLQHLTFLSLSNNQLSGQVPDVFHGLTKLATLYIQNNNLEGQLPSSLFALTQLSSLDCSLNKFEGPLPKKITGFPNLIHLYLNDNQLNESIASWCLSLSSMKSLDLSNNQFIGHIGDISSSSLEVLDLCGNKLQGNIPESIFNLANLTSLCLSSNNWSSSVHFPLFSKFQNLKFLTLSGYSSLSLKSEINVSYSFPSLIELCLLSNNFTNYREALVKFPVLRLLELSNSNLQGKVPKWILDIDSLYYLVLSRNLLTSIDSLRRNSLSYFDVSSNMMIGDISSFICNATSLQIINLSHNNFTGAFPQCLANFSLISVLDLQMNNLHGMLSSTMNMGLFTLNLNGNKFEGSLPKSLSNNTLMTYLNLGNNQIEDSFPHWLESLQYLRILILRANKLYGPIVSLVKKNPFPNLIVFDISCNNFSGPLPEDYIKSFQVTQIGLQNTDLEYMATYMIPLPSSPLEYDNSLVATVKGVKTSYMKIPIAFANIDLSVNKFEGEIPNVIGELQGLLGLNLSHNKLTGPIPRSIGNLTNLESLDLSSNMLTGEIPLELTSLNSLEVLNLAHNHLVGAIPQGKQLNTFSNESYEGNIGLCGFPLTIQCNKVPDQPPPSSPTFETEEKLGFGWKPVAIGYGCGMVFGIGLGWLVLFIGEPIWLVRMFGGGPNKRVRRRSRATRTHGNRARVN